MALGFSSIIFRRENDNLNTLLIFLRQRGPFISLPPIHFELL